MTSASAGQTPAIEARNIVKRFGGALASADSDYMTGQLIMIDGGMVYQ